MDPQHPPKRPVITSLAAALSDIARWQKASQLDVFKDAEGQVWSLTVKTTQVPSAADPRKVLWQVSLGLSSAVTAAGLVASGVLNAKEDDRLIEMIGSDSIPLAMKPTVHTAVDEEAARALLARELPQLKLSFAKTSLVQVKRTLVGRWLNGRSRFGGQRST